MLLDKIPRETLVQVFLDKIPRETLVKCFWTKSLERPRLKIPYYPSLTETNDSLSCFITESCRLYFDLLALLRNVQPGMWGLT